jgi:arginine decarboxylase-like protein
MITFLAIIENMQHILLGTDSRGAYFEDFLSQHNLFPNDWEIHIDVTPGGTIKTISEKHLTKVKTLPVTVNTQIVIMIAGGIHCNHENFQQPDLFQFVPASLCQSYFLLDTFKYIHQS